jgi:nucleotide-binding universal stress UspA family protein
MRVVVAIDPHDRTFDAVLRVAAGFLDPATEVRITHVYSPPLEWFDDPADPGAQRTLATLQGLRAGIRERLPPEFASAKIDVLPSESANAGNDIVAQAKRVAADLVVIGTRGDVWRGLFIGSVAERVVRTAHCDVYVVRPPAEE